MCIICDNANESLMTLLREKMDKETYKVTWKTFKKDHGKWSETVRKHHLTNIGKARRILAPDTWTMVIPSSLSVLNMAGVVVVLERDGPSRFPMKFSSLFEGGG